MVRWRHTCDGMGLSKADRIKARCLIPYGVLILVPALGQIRLEGLQDGDGRELRMQLLDIALRVDSTDDPLTRELSSSLSV